MGMVSRGRFTSPMQNGDAAPALTARGDSLTLSRLELWEVHAGWAAVALRAQDALSCLSAVLCPCCGHCVDGDKPFTCLCFAMGFGGGKGGGKGRGDTRKRSPTA